MERVNIRGTDNRLNQVHDAGMSIFNQVPPEFTDAYQLAAQATAYVKEHGGTLSFDGHSLGGTISQLNRKSVSKNEHKC